MVDLHSPVLPRYLLDAQERLLLKLRRASDGIAPLLADALINKQFFERKECENGLKQLVGLKDSLATSIGPCCEISDFCLVGDASPLVRAIWNLFEVNVVGRSCCGDGGGVVGSRFLNDG